MTPRALRGGPGPPPVSAVCLVVLDGWGLADPEPGNAVELAQTPVFDALWATYPHARLRTSGRAVGLPDGQMGNSEVGHLNLGAGAIVRQDLTRIDDAVADGSFRTNPVLIETCARARRHGRLHLVGLVSGGGVHSSLGHLRACIGLAAAEGVSDIVLHAFTDGRDTLPRSGAGHLAEVERWLAAAGGRVGTVGGRYWAMDRDRRFDRTKLAYEALVGGVGAAPSAATGVEAVEAGYARGETDEFVLPTVVGAEGRIRPGDSVLFFNFRSDRARQLSRALADPAFDGFDRLPSPDVALTTLTSYHEDWAYPVAFPPERPRVTLASMLAERGTKQLHVAETEKYAHVTYFFNGGEEDPYVGEDRCLVDSPRDVATYDQRPAMSAAAAADAFVERWAKHDYGFGIINFANPDMVGHTGVISAAVAAVETVDSCLGRVVDAVHARAGACVITADHGNAEQMLEPDGSPNTAHSVNPVPVIITAEVAQPRDGVLADVAPTVIALLGFPQPAEMTGVALHLTAER